MLKNFRVAENESGLISRLYRAEGEIAGGEGEEEF